MKTLYSVVGRSSILFMAAVAMAVIANGASPKGIPWSQDLDARVEGQAIRQGIATVDFTEFQRLATQGQALVLDARGTESFAEGHVPGALSLPIAEVDMAFEALQLLLPVDQSIVVYCSGRACDESLRLAVFLREQGYRQISLFPGGYEAWLSAQLQIEEGY